MMRMIRCIRVRCSLTSGLCWRYASVAIHTLISPSIINMPSHILSSPLTRSHSLPLQVRKLNKQYDKSGGQFDAMSDDDDHDWDNDDDNDEDNDEDDFEGGGFDGLGLALGQGNDDDDDDDDDYSIDSEDLLGMEDEDDEEDDDDEDEEDEDEAFIDGT